jgi:AcrR family transcriptional regulator
MIGSVSDVAGTAPAREGGSADTRERLLDAAEDLFARKGYAAASVRDIVAAAGCNLAAVNYHFGSKRNLYQEVFRRRLGAMREQRLAAVKNETTDGDDERDLETTLHSFALAFLAPLQEDSRGRRPLRLMLREIADPLLPWGFLHGELIVPVNRALAAAVGRAAPELSDREVRLCVQSFLGQLLHSTHAQRFAGAGSEHDDDSSSLAELVEHVVRFTVAGIDHLRRGNR